MNGHTITNRGAVNDVWAQNFMHLSSSNASESPAISNLDSLIHSYRLASFYNADLVLECNTTTDEIKSIVSKLKMGKASGPDNILPEHIIYGGDYLTLWLKKIFNEILHLEQIPSYLKESVIIPIYKGKGKDPLLTNNYRGISLSSIISKIFEQVILLRMIPILEEKGIPHRTQTAYQAGISCCDATEVVQEVVKAYISCGSIIFQCFYDLEKCLTLLNTMFFSTTCTKQVSMGKLGLAARITSSITIILYSVISTALEARYLQRKHKHTDLCATTKCQGPCQCVACAASRSPTQTSA